MPSDQARVDPQMCSSLHEAGNFDNLLHSFTAVMGFYNSSIMGNCVRELRSPHRFASNRPRPSLNECSPLIVWADDIENPLVQRDYSA